MSSIQTPDLDLKRFFDSKQYHKALDLFEKQSQMRTDASVHMAIKACTELRDYTRGNDIIKHLPSHLLNNRDIQALLIRFYSRFIGFDRYYE